MEDAKVRRRGRAERADFVRVAVLPRVLDRDRDEEAVRVRLREREEHGAASIGVEQTLEPLRAAFHRVHPSRVKLFLDELLEEVHLVVPDARAPVVQRVRGRVRRRFLRERRKIPRGSLVRAIAAVAVARERRPRLCCRAALRGVIVPVIADATFPLRRA